MKFLLKLCTAIVLLLLLGMAVTYPLSRLGDEPLDAGAREQLGGTYLPTAHGIISYVRQGPKNAPAMILVHGFSTPKFVWEQVTPTLLELGYQVIAYDHLGRGFSERPAGPYNAALYRSELAGIIEGLALTTPVTLVGYSMGGANVIDYAAEHPTQVDQLILIAPAGYMDASPGIGLALAPGLGEWISSVFGKQYAYAGIKAEVDAGGAPADMLQKFEQQADYHGYTDAMLSTLRHYPMANMADRYRVVGRSGIPVTAIWGTDDKVVPYSGAARMAADVPQLKLITIEGGNHNITFGKADVVAAALKEALTADK